MAVLDKAIQIYRRPTPGGGVALDPTGRLPPSVPVCSLRMLTADPAAALNGEFWFRTDQVKLCVKTSAGVVRVTLA